MHKICFKISFISCLYMFRAHESSSGGQNCITQPLVSSHLMCDDTRGCVMQFWPPDDEHISSKHVKSRNKTLWKKICASSWLNTEINILRCTVSKTSKHLQVVSVLISFTKPLLLQPALGYHITNRQSRYITPARLKSAYTTQQVVASSWRWTINVWNMLSSR